MTDMKLIPIKPEGDYVFTIGLLGVKITQSELDYGGNIHLINKRLEEIERRILLIEGA